MLKELKFNEIHTELFDFQPEPSALFSLIVLPVCVIWENQLIWSMKLKDINLRDYPVPSTGEVLGYISISLARAIEQSLIGFC